MKTLVSSACGLLAALSMTSTAAAQPHDAAFMPLAQEAQLGAGAGAHPHLEGMAHRELEMARHRARGVVSWRPLSLITNRIAVDYEQRVNPWISVVGTVGVILPHAWKQSTTGNYLNFRAGLNLPSQHAGIGGQVEVGPRFWMSHRGLHGFYLHPSVQYAFASSGASDNANGANGNDVPRTHRIAVNVRAGHQWLFAKHVALSVDGGIVGAGQYAGKQFVGDMENEQQGRVIDGGWSFLGFSPSVHVGLGGWF